MHCLSHVSFSCIVAVTIYLIVAPLDKSRSQATAAMVMRFLFYFQSMISLVSVFIFNLRSAATPNNIWHDFTDSIHKNPHLLCLTVRKFDNKLELLNLWVEKNIITFRLFGVSIDRYLPGKIFAGMSSIAISAGFVIGRMTGTFWICVNRKVRITCFIDYGLQSLISSYNLYLRLCTTFSAKL